MHFFCRDARNLNIEEKVFVMKQFASISLAVVLCASLFSCAKEKDQNGETVLSKGTAAVGDHGYGRKIAVQSMVFQWSLSKDSIRVKIAGHTTGWIGIGFNPSEAMKDANFVMGMVKNGIVTVSNQHGTSRSLHKSNTDLGGKDHVTAAAGVEKDNMTEISFTMPLKTGDSLDRPIDPAGETVVLLAYGKADLLAQQHSFRAKLRVNLSTGDYVLLHQQRQ